MQRSVRSNSQSARARAHHDKAVRESKGRGRPGRNPAESPVAWLYSRRDAAGNSLISEAQFNAGERLRADFWYGHMSPNVTQSWNASPATASGRRSAPGAGVELADNIVAAQERVRRALAAVGPELCGILIDVCCHLRGLEDAERRAGWPQRSGKIVLGVALSALARHYGLTAPATARTSRVRHWGDGTHRPSIDANLEEHTGEGA